jgi:hypothetical protein
MSDVLKMKLQRDHASVAGLRRRHSVWQVSPPLGTGESDRHFDERQPAIDWIVSHGWGVHETK